MVAMVIIVALMWTENNLKKKHALKCKILLKALVNSTTHVHFAGSLSIPSGRSEVAH